MAVPGRKAQILVEAVDATKSAMDSVERNLGRVNNAAAMVSSVMSRAFMATAAIQFGRNFATAAIEAEQASNRLTAVLRATGHAAGLTKAELDKMADSMAESTQFDDESVREAQAVLLKFGNVQEDVFKRALKMAADYAAFTGSAIPEAAQTLGKALASPAEGVGALERQIGKFNPVQKQMIEDLVATGKHAEAQGMILDILAGKIGGTADQMNTGLFKAVKDVGKAWDEMLEAIGRTEAYQSKAKSSLGFLEQSLKDIKEIVENGDWVEKTLAILAFAGGFRGMKLTQRPTPPASPQDRATAASGAASARQQQLEAAAWAEVAETDKWFPAWQNAEREKGKSERERQLREAEKAAQAHVDVEEQAAQDAREAWGFYTQQQADEQKEFADGQKRMWQAVFEQIDQEQEQAIEDGKILLDSMNDKLKESEAFARDLGLTFTSAFEDAAISGKKLSDVIKGLGKDIARVIARETITLPVDKAVSGWVNSIDWGGAFKDLFGGGRAGGGPVEAGRMYEVAEQGPELLSAGGRQYLMMGASGGTVTPAGAGGAGGGVTVVQHNTFQSGVSRAEIASMLPRIKQAAIAGVYDARRRGLVLG